MANNIEQNFLIDLYHNGDFGKSRSGDIQQVKGKENLRQAVINRIITVPGALAHRPNYGIGIQRYKNLSLTIDKKREMALAMKQLEEDERIKEVTKVSIIESTEVAGEFSITVSYDAIGIGNVTETINPFEVRV